MTTNTIQGERVLVCGDQNWTNTELVYSTLDAIHASTPIGLIIEGEARGADSMGRDWARSRQIPFDAYPANWSKFGRAAGPIRNQEQLDKGKPTQGIAFHNDIENSKGTRDMVRRLKQANVPVKVVIE